ncbi:hypothetical protein KY363_02240 [Candidatus Woesearchaeota archaeon]|nr:hypothetical protein [Candidatus Woesearchaeota archaeon]
MNGYDSTRKRKREDDERFYTPFPSTPYGMTLPSKGIETMLPPAELEGAAQNYSRSMQAMSPQYAMMQPAGMQGALPMYGNQSAVSIQYTAADGSTYQIGFSTSQANKGAALDMALGYLKAIMMAEGKGYRGSYAHGKAYGGAGGRSSYAGGGRSAGYAGGSSGSGGGSGGK